MQFTSVTFTALAVVSASFLAPAESTNLREQLRVGQQVKVEGQVQDGAFHAQHITLRDAENTVKVEGAIDEVSDGGRQIQLLDFAVAVDRSTRLYRGNQPTSSRSMLVRGAWIEAKGTWRHGVLKATRVRLKSSPEPTQEIEGIIQFADSSQSTLLILDRAVHVPQDAVIVDERTEAAVGDQSSRLRRDDDDAGDRVPIAFGNVIAGGRVEAGFLNEENFDVGQRDIERTVLARVQVLASAQVTESIEAYTKITMSQNVIPGSSTRGDARLSEGYLMFHRLGGAPVDLQIGRQRFRDSREWIFDDYLDAARVHVNLPAVRLEAAVSRGIFSGEERVRERRDQLQFFASAVTHVGAAQVGGYALARRDTTRDERPIWIGGRLNGRAGINWNYWGDVVARRGASGASRLAGWAFDTGVKHTWSQRWSPTVTVGYAFGSGDHTRGDGRDTRFRQTDLEDNRAYFGGLRRVAIYGELFDPELSNLRVFTVGFGVRPRRNFAVDAIYHRSAQAIATTALPSSNLDGSLEGRQGALGDELNVVFTLRAVPGVDFDLAVGAFLPGRAFGAARTSAFFWRPQLRFSF